MPSGSGRGGGGGGMDEDWDDGGWPPPEVGSSQYQPDDDPILQCAAGLTYGRCILQVLMLRVRRLQRTVSVPQSWLWQEMISETHCLPEAFQH